MSIDEVIENALFDYCVAWRDRGHAIQDRIERDLCTAIEQHVEAEMAWRDAEIERLRKANEELYHGTMRQAIRLTATEPKP